MNESSVAREADAYLNAMTKLGKFSGSVLISQEGEVVCCAGFGLADREHTVTNKPQTKYRIGSITKQFTAMAILILQEQGKLSLHDSVAKHLPYAPNTWREITLHHLLNHTSGLIRSNDTRAAEKLPLTVREITDTITRTPLIFKAGTDHSYSNDGYILLGDIIERASGAAYADFLNANIFQPLEMADSGYDFHENVLANRATGYCKRGGHWMRAEYIDMGCPFSAGALYSTVEDLHRWDLALHAGRLISRESYAQMTAVAPLLANYGYGFAIGREHNRRTIGHAGGINGFRANFVRYPDEPACVIVLGNSEVSDFFGVSKTLGAILFGETYQIPPVKSSVDVTKKVLAKYVGEYKMASGISLHIHYKDGRLMAAAGQAQSEYVPESDAVFFREESDDTIAFHNDSDGDHLTLRQADVETVATRIRPQLDF